MSKSSPCRFVGIFAATVIAMAFSAGASAQGLPATDLWLARIVDGVPEQASKISQGVGYNNQPHFSADGTVIYYTREMPADDGATQTDIAAYDLRTAATTMVNHTPESEYSPTPIPGRNALSVIQMDLDQKQYLYAIDISSGDMEVLLPDVEPVGYHAWVNDHEVAMFILGDSFTLQTARLGTQGTNVIADNIGRSLRRHPQTGEILFVDKNSEPWQIAAFNPKTSVTRRVMPLFPANEDFTIDDKGMYWTGNGSSLYRRTPDDARWELMADYSNTGVGRITRLAVNPQCSQIALVGDHL
jgi:hypothetical protein